MECDEVSTVCADPRVAAPAPELRGRRRSAPLRAATFPAGAGGPVSARAATPAESHLARDLRAVILLAGSVGRNPFADGIGRSVLDMPIDARTTVLDEWIERAEGFASALGLSSLRVRVAVDQGSPLPRVRRSGAESRVVVEIVRDPAEYRGTAGIVRDLTRQYSDDDLVVVAGANQIQREELNDSFEPGSGEESVSIVPHGDGEFAAMFLLRCARLRDVPEVGFVDLKEQAIPSARGRPPLLVVRRPANSTLPIRTLPEYVRALRELHGGADREQSRAARGSAFDETWQPLFSIVEPGASVAPNAVLQDTVVLAGGRVEEGATVARSVVCDGGVVRRGQCVLETVVTR